MRTARSALRIAEVRLRIPLILLVSALIVGRWEAIRNHWDRLTRSTGDQSANAQAVSNDTEYFCPMDPGVVADWPGRCGVCNMALVRRKRGEATALPDGVVARMQVSPYRIQLAGIRTAPIEYRPLKRIVSAAGVVRREGKDLLVPIEIPPATASSLDSADSVTVRGRELAVSGPLHGRLRPRPPSGTDVLLDGKAAALPPGTLAEVNAEIPVARLEPFHSMPSDPPALKPGEPRRVFACPDHPANLATEAGRCPEDRNELQSRTLAGLQRLRWWCPMHPEVTSDHAGATCQSCGGMILKPRILSYAPAGQVLALPEPAVVDTGLRTVVFVETMPGTFDGVEVELGPRCGEFFPVVRGLEAGQRVVISGAFLLDAETRLNPSLAATYFGAGRRGAADRAASVAVPASPESSSPLEKLAAEDRRLAERQETCPVTGKPLGSMGVPPRISVSGRVVFLCCGGCEDAVRSDPKRYLAKLPAASSP